MKRWGILFFCTLFLAVLGFGEGLPSSFTAFKGNVTLFDDSSPWAGLNNPALMVGYGGYPNPWVFRSASTTNPEMNFGRFYLFSTSIGFGVNTSFYKLVEAYLYWFAYTADSQSASSLKAVMDSILPFTGWAFDTSMLSRPTNDFAYLQKALNLVISNTTAGFYTRWGLAGFSLFLPLKRVLSSIDLPLDLPLERILPSIDASSIIDESSFGIQNLVDIEAYGSLTSERSSFFFFRDPEVFFWLKAGTVVSVGLGKWEIPLFGKVAVGTSIGLYPYMARMRFMSIDDIVTYREAIATNQQAVFGYEHLRQGFGANMDLGFMKTLGESWRVALKIENLLSPIVWRFSGQEGKQQYAFDWIFPNVVAGVRYTYPIVKPLKFFVNEPSLYFEIEDLLYTKPLALLSKLRIGADVKVLIDMLQVGVGLNQGYPTIGGRLSMTLSWLRDLPGLPGWVNTWFFPITMGNLTAYLAYYGKELGHYPGHKDAMGYMFGVEYYLEFGVNGPSRKFTKEDTLSDRIK